MIDHRIGGEKEFHWRGGDISRVEGFSDAVFAFAITLLVVSLQVPRTFNDLVDVMRGFPAFGICFLLLCQVWFFHYTFFRRYGLHDPITTWLNALLLFVVVFYVYPLKFVFTLLVTQVMGGSMTVTAADGQTRLMIEKDQIPQLFIVFGLGWIAVNLIFAILYFRAYRLREVLELNAIEREATRATIETFLINCAIAGLSIALAVVIGGDASGFWAGMTYWLIPVALTLHGMWRGRRIRQLEAP
jgi:uncharacterized membrane protein